MEMLCRSTGKKPPPTDGLLVEQTKEGYVLVFVDEEGEETRVSLSEGFARALVDIIGRSNAEKVR